QDMEGFTDRSGEVVAVGDEATTEQETRPGEERYEVEDVPHVMYFNFDAEALHGAYWHQNFGQKMSHGCVNLPLDVAAFLYAWAPLGTAVTVYE
nr:L,D-transpeptidase [Chloroflexia bacterium]